MAEIQILPDFGYEGGGFPTIGASSRVQFLEDGEYRYSMDLIRAFNLTLGFDGYKPETFETLRNAGNSEWGITTLSLVIPKLGAGHVPSIGKLNNRTHEYFNSTLLVSNQTAGGNMSLPGPVGAVSYNLLDSKYTMVFTNTTAAGFEPESRSGCIDYGVESLTFPELRLSPSIRDQNWRDTEEACLPPKVRLKDPYRVEGGIYDEVAGIVDGTGCVHFHSPLGRTKPRLNGGYGSKLSGLWSQEQSLGSLRDTRLAV
ncbi:hypothetical protein L873DRAFT_463378 [Choiromyces venosus 120613-1]|uniref:Uncharacterized protein n=1 Tax=Choiromyces venosus 120613-1 TaxID=1336337 RepID=A0A3N4JVQ4_9PEZI|nr:hypothetical protein L873DRAFT_463378 [Choiromyces venosus 120613-1]